MPLYDFRCERCERSYEAHAPLGGLAGCPACGSDQVERVMTGFAGPFKTRPRGRAERRSDAVRRVREEQRAERGAARAEQNPGTI